MQALILENVWFRYAAEARDLFRGLDLIVNEGESVALVGPSGSGKTTLLRVAAGLELPQQGTVHIQGTPMGLTADQRRDLRAREIGLVFDRPRLLTALTAEENVVAARLPWQTRSALRAEAAALLDACGLIGRHGDRPQGLSGGERQLVSVARALLGGHRVLLADEPTAHLDRSTGQNLMAVLLEQARSMGAVVLFSTHDPHIAEMASRTTRLADGVLAA